MYTTIPTFYSPLSLVYGQPGIWKRKKRSNSLTTKSILQNNKFAYSLKEKLNWSRPPHPYRRKLRKKKNLGL
jgi:hypothetical protein